MAGCAQPATPTDDLYALALKQVPVGYGDVHLLGISYLAQDGRAPVAAEATFAAIYHGWGTLTVSILGLFPPSFTSGADPPECQETRLDWTATPAQAIAAAIADPEAQTGLAFLESPSYTVTFHPSQTICKDGQDKPSSIEVTAMGGGPPSNLHTGQVTILLDGAANLLETRIQNPMVYQAISAASAPDGHALDFDVKFNATFLYVDLQHQGSGLSLAEVTYTLSEPGGKTHTVVIREHQSFTFNLLDAPAGKWHLEGESVQPMEWTTPLKVEGRALTMI